jgi:hypothetical protein
MKKRRNVFAASLMDGKFQQKIVPAKKLKILIKELNKSMKELAQ